MLTKVGIPGREDMWIISLGTECATRYSRGKTALEACRMFRDDYFPWHEGKAPVEKRKSEDLAELFVDGCRIRAERIES